MSRSSPSKHRPLRRFLLASVIVGFWLAMMMLLIRRERPGTAHDIQPFIVAETPLEGWFGVYLADGARIGHLHLRELPQERAGKPGGALTLDARMLLELMGKPTELEVAGSAWRAAATGEGTFDFRLTTAGYQLAVEGRATADALDVEIHTEGEVIPLHLEIEEPTLLMSGFGSVLRMPPLEVGEEHRLVSFDPLTLRPGHSRVRCVGRETLRIGGETLVTRLLAVEGNGVSSRMWIDASGLVVRAETPFGLVLEKLDRAAALAPVHPEGAGGFLELSAVRPTGMRPFRGAAAMTVRLSGVATAELPDDDAQKRDDSGRLLVTAPAAPEPAPLAGGSGGNGYLGGDPLIQVDHPQIRAQASAIVGTETDPWQKALRIYQWVFENVTKEAVPSVPSALAVLAERRGDCNEHTVLFAALARAAGVPTRLAVGLVWSEQLDGFYYHAWPEVLVGDWVRMDPTLGQPLADATHLKLLEGGIESWPRLAAYLGRLEIEVVDVR